jgi:hypothetical protein
MILPGLGAMENRSSSPRLSAVVQENWMEKATTAEAFALRQWEFLRTERPETSLVEQKGLSGGPFRDAYGMALRAAGPEGAALRQEQIFAIEGPLAACLTLTGPEADPDRRERAFESVRRSFQVRGAQALREMVRAPLVAGAPSGGPGPARTPVPHLQIAVPVPAGWRLDPEEGTLRSAEGAEIAVKRAGLSADSPEELFAEALARALGDSSMRPRAWDHAATLQGFEAFALECVGAAAGTWAKKEPQITRETIALDASAVVFRLRASDGSDAAKAAFAQIVGGYEMLPPAKRRLRVPLAWLPVELSGPWRQGAPGIFARAALPALSLAATRIPAVQGLEKFAEAAARSLHPSAAGVRIEQEERRAIPWKGLPLFRYTADFVEPAGERVSLRAAWFGSGESVCSIIVRGSGEEADALFALCLDRLRPTQGEAP